MSTTQQLINNAGQYWQEYVHHTFVQQLANGTLPKACFQHYLKQDYLFLFQYNRALSLGIYKAENFAQMKTAHEAIGALLHEIQLHIQFCGNWGIDEKTLFSTEESAACVAYTRYVLDAGMTGGLAELYTAIAPCAIGYAVIAKHIVESGVSPENNPYQAWIDAYSGEEFQTAAQNAIEALDALCAGLTDTQLAKLQQIFNTATRMESAFWQMGLDLS
ncbi:thiaminase II [Pasteurella dagmatis]|uniref:Aminopyrimidine aminohydrolase n=1 Tax=Pasteurella dagmatis ATCC 43325 TaxID=667128 RepID=C9PP02_9PAST|nr:thiaminase II [Pasteurella dagmatis]EEX50793.1 TENA/THI-4 family protein [Pasteurella dagmatis ATCC 43325]SNV78910.1 TENA/THI-4 protein/Coenzyme PQQ biosynthesis protein C family protein [Pasteurella dagmatis]